MTLRFRHVIAALLLAGVLASASCGRRNSGEPSEEHLRSREMELFQSAIHTVQERYVDVDRVQLDLLISNSLKGMIQAADPYAEILAAGKPADVVVPPDARMIEMGGVDERGFATLRVYGFNDQLKKQLRKLEPEFRELHLSGILLDCRGSFGDDYTAASALAEWFLPKDSPVGAMLEKQGEQVTVLSTKRNPIWATNTVVMLIDRQTSGPAELLASALRFHQRCLLVGEPSRGVAVIQTVIPLANDWHVRISTGRVLGPGGINLTGNPQAPDIEAQPEPGNKENVDWILHRGMTLLRDQHTL